MLRIPGSLNSNLVQFDSDRIISIPYEAEVRVIRPWDGNRPSIKPILPDYYIWLQSIVAKELDKQIGAAQNVRKYNYNRKLQSRHATKNTITWIEKLLDTPLDDYRKYTIRLILAPYLINIRHCDRQDAFNIISTWLDKCDCVCRLQFDIDRKISEAFDKVGGFLPLGRN